MSSGSREVCCGQDENSDEAFKENDNQGSYYILKIDVNLLVMISFSLAIVFFILILVVLLRKNIRKESMHEYKKIPNYGLPCCKLPGHDHFRSHF